MQHQKAQPPHQAPARSARFGPPPPARTAARAAARALLTSAGVCWGGAGEPAPGMRRLLRPLLAAENPAAVRLGTMMVMEVLAISVFAVPCA